MAYSTTRGLLYTAPPTDDGERTTENEPTIERSSTATVESSGANHAGTVADD